MNALLEQAAALPQYIAAHLVLTLVSLAMGIVISLPVGVLATRNPRLERWALGAASVMQTIPALALLALMVPLLGFLGGGLQIIGLPAPPTIGFLPAVVALSLYSVLPILRNTVTGIAGVDPALREAARGVGMSPREVLFQVELPLALPTVIAGIRTATVWVVGTATLATPVGGTSLGNPIFAGLQTRNLAEVLVASLAAALLALCLDGLVRSMEISWGRGQRRRCLAALLALGAALAWASAYDGAWLARVTQPGVVDRPIAIGSKSFTEQYILAEILAGLAERDPRVDVHRVPSLGSTVAFDGLASGELDLYVDYSGTLWATILKRDTVGVDREALLRVLRTELEADYGVHLVSALGFENTYALAMREADAAARDIVTISDLVRHAGELEILGDYEFFGRPEWVALQDGYGLDFRNERAMDSSLMYEALQSGSGDVISAYSTDGRIVAYDLRVLTDDRSVIPPYDALVLAGGRVVREQPELIASLSELDGAIGGDTMRSMNAAVDLSGQAPSRVAAEWLESCRPSEGRVQTARPAQCKGRDPLGPVSDPGTSGR